jgi:hypothetical protein
MTRLIKIADWDSGVRVNVVFGHGGGHAGANAPPTNWLGTTGLALQDCAGNGVEGLLGEREQKKGGPSFRLSHPGRPGGESKVLSTAGAPAGPPRRRF